MMEDDDKPFVCTEHGCGMRFTNEDHLAVHMKKHDMSLALNLGSNNTLSPTGGLFVDQTPTPTKFLRNCEEIGLFQELTTKNPFEEAFKKASDVPEDAIPTTVNPSAVLPGPGSNDLHTPTPMIPKVVDKSDDDNHHMPKSREATVNSIVPKKRSKFLSAQVQATSTTSDDDEVVIASSTNIDLVNSLVASAKRKESSPQVSSSTIEVETLSPPPQSQSPASVVQSRPSVVQSTASAGVSPTASSVQVFLQLPNGQTLPVQIPVQITPAGVQQVTQVQQQQVHQVQPPLQQQQQLPQVQNVPTVAMVQRHVPMTTSPLTVASVPKTVLAATQQTGTGSQSVHVINSTPQTIRNQPTPHKSPATTPSPTSQPQSLAKQKLKAAIQQQTTPTGSVKVSQIFQMVQEMKREPQDTPLMIDTSSIASYSDTNLSSPEDSPSPFKQSKLNDDDPEDRRKKFLERNRAAAARCRQKRKQWVNNLEHKADELSKVNNKLQTEVNSLRGEVAQLKSLLLAHKDCPITLQQQSQGQLTQQSFVFTESPDQVNHSTVLPDGLIAPTVINQGASVAIAGIATATSVPMIPTVVTNDVTLHNGDKESPHLG